MNSCCKYYLSKWLKNFKSIFSVIFYIHEQVCRRLYVVQTKEQSADIYYFLYYWEFYYLRISIGTTMIKIGKYIF